MSEAYLFKMMVLYSSGVHPYRLMLRSCEDFYTEAEAIGMRVTVKQVVTPQDQSCTFQIWNLIPSVRHRNMYASYSLGAKSAFIFFNMCNRSTYDSLFYWVRFLRSVNPDVTIFIIGLNNGPDRQCEEREIREFSRAHRIDGYYLLNENLNRIPEEIFVRLAEITINHITSHHFNPLSYFNNPLVSPEESILDDSRGRLSNSLNSCRDIHLLPPPPPDHPIYENNAPYPDIPSASDLEENAGNIEAILPPLSCFANSTVFEEHIRHFISQRSPFDIPDPDSNVVIDNSLSDLRNEMLQELERLRRIMNGDTEARFDSKISKLSVEEKWIYRNFLEFYKICPICGSENHKSYLMSFYFSERPQRQGLKQVLLHYMDACINNPENVSSDFIYGIPCCHCYKDVFNESEAPRG